MLLICYVLKYVTIHRTKFQLFCTDVKKCLLKKMCLTFSVSIFETDMYTIVGYFGREGLRVRPQRGKTVTLNSKYNVMLRIT
jgi:hypothetical protein